MFCGLFKGIECLVGCVCESVDVCMHLCVSVGVVCMWVNYLGFYPFRQSTLISVLFPFLAFTGFG